MPEQKQEYAVGDTFIDNQGSTRKVVAVIGDVGPKPTIVVKDVEGRTHYLTPSVPLGVYGDIASLIPELKDGAQDASIVVLINTASKLCIKHSPYFTPEFIVENFEQQILVKMLEEVFNLATEVVNANIMQYNEDHDVKNGQSGMSRSIRPSRQRRRKRKQQAEIGHE